jgi:RNA polymerase sigma-70 factor (ECF subfamily)
MRPVLRVISRSPTEAKDGPPACDRALAKAVARGQGEAVRELVRRCLPVVHAVARRLLNDPVEAEDVAQETFVKVWRSIGRFDPVRGRLEAWAGKIAANACYDRLRKRGESLLDDGPPDRPDGAPQADSVLAAKDGAARVRAAIEMLPPRQRAALELCALRDHSNIEAAEILGVSVEALESLLSRARRTLKTQLAGERAALLEALSEGQGGEA